MDVSLVDVADFLRRNSDFYILTHVHPDGDSLGSAFALCRVLQKMGKKTCVVTPDSIPERFLFLVDIVKKFDFFLCKTVVCVDFSHRALLGSLDFPEIHLCIDHHKTEKGIGSLSYIDSSAAANSEIIYDLIKIMGEEVDPEIASCIYTGIATDTGRFKYSNVTAKTFGIVKEIFNKIDNFQGLNQILFGNKSKNFFEFRNQILSEMEYLFDDRFVFLVVRLTHLDKFGVSYEEAKSVVSLPLDVVGVEFVVTLKEDSTDFYRISIRTSDKFSALLLCKEFGGGGHLNAGGFQLEGDLNELKNRILKKCVELYNFKH
ncbi:MAG: DHH family phosphoesterase [Oscillospiraceae bacterium]|nr:DHH family phosphoesterase [Oscillospiraceae bacterium]